MITQEVVDALGLKSTGITKTLHANGESLAEIFLISLKFSNSIGFAYLRATKGILGAHLRVLIGMDVITQGDFSITNHDGATELNFMCPSQGLKALHDAHQRMKKAPPTPAAPPAPPKPFAGTPRNAECPCGSGKKYKKCCGL